MLKLIEGLPATVIGVEGGEQVTAEDYVQVLVPAVEKAKAASDSGKIRVLYVLPEKFPDYSAGAMWQDPKLGFGELRHWEKIAIVGDADWLRHAIHGLGWMMPGEVKMFSTGELDAARDWVTA